jgi:hypothetical protein
MAAAGLLVKSGFGAEGAQNAPRHTGDHGKTVALVCDPADAIAAAKAPQWALDQLSKALTALGITVRRCRRIGDVGAAEFCIVAASPKSSWLKEVLEQAKITLPDSPETLALASAGLGDKTALFAVGSDERGLMYAILEVADRVVHSDPPLAAIEAQKPIVEQPANAIRSIARLFVSNVEDLPWYRDKSFWENYFTMLSTERFNRFALTLGLGYDFTRQIHDCYFHFAYPFFLAVPGYNVRAAGLPDAERDENLLLLRWISEAATKRGLDFQLGLWTHAYRWADSPQANYTIDGLNSDNHANYCREALTQLLSACPAIHGVTIRTHGESGVPEGSYEFWETIFKGAAGAGRKVEIDLHAKGIDQRMIEGALATGMPINVSPKYWAEHTGLPYHQAAIRSLEMPPASQRSETASKGAGSDNSKRNADGKASNQSLFALSNGQRRFMRYSYGDLFRENREYGVMFRMWPGSMKLLLWGDPAMAAAWGRYASFCGSTGMEIQEPLSFKGKQGSGLAGGRNAYQDEALKPAADWEKYAYTYRLWGRLLYNPDADPEVWRRMLQKNWGAAALSAEQALAHSSRIIPLITSAHLPSAANNNYWPEIYTNMSLVDATAGSPYSDTPSPKRFGTVSPLDPVMFSTIDEYAAEIVAKKFSGKYTPVQVISWLNRLVEDTRKHLTQITQQAGAKSNPDLKRLIADVQIQIGLGEFFAQKIESALLFGIYQQSKDRRGLEEAVKQYQTARDTWAKIAQGADGVYVSDITFGPEKQLRGCWSERLAAIDQDVQRMKKLLEGTATVQVEKSSDWDGIRQLLDSKNAANPTSISIVHQPPKQFHPGDAVPIKLTVGYTSLVKADDLQSSTLHYRHVNQAEKYETAEMKADANRWAAMIPGEYTQSQYPLQYFFALTSANGHTWQFPGFDETLCNQPYFVVRQG